jgi:hypothetical protein
MREEINFVVHERDGKRVGLEVGGYNSSKKEK